MPGFSFSDPSVWEAAEDFQNDAPVEPTYVPQKKAMAKPSRKERLSELELFNQLNNFKSAKPKKAQSKKLEAQSKKLEAQSKKLEAQSKKQELGSKNKQNQPSKKPETQSNSKKDSKSVQNQFQSNPQHNQSKSQNQPKPQNQPKSQKPKSKAVSYPGLICLTWADFDSHMVRLGYKQLRNKSSQMDVTLSCEGQTLKAHKKILSACSPLLKDRLKAADSKSILNLKNTTYSDLSAILEFMYAGEVYVEEAQLASVLRTAEKLQVKGMISPSEE